MTTAICPGSFDPITLGHVDIICRAAEIFDEVVVCVMHNAAKKSPMFTLEEKLSMARRAVEGYKNVRVDSYDGLVSNWHALGGDDALAEAQEWADSNK